jgi:hypothetical protein
MKKYAKEYRRKEILEKGMKFKEGWIKLVYSHHALDRLKERLKGNIELMPNAINISKLNINKGYSYDGLHLHKVVIRLEFKPTEWIYLVILPSKRIVKSLWFSDKKHEKRNTGTVGVLSTDMEDTPRTEEMPEL